ALWGGLAAAAGLLALLAAPAVTRVRLRRSRLRRRGPVEAADPAPGEVTSVHTDAAARHRAHAAWDELLDIMVDFGVPLRPAESPRVTAARLVKRYRLDRDAGAVPAAEEPSVGDQVRLLGYAEE